jgi:hypothetical protein
MATRPVREKKLLPPQGPVLLGHKPKTKPDQQVEKARQQAADIKEGRMQVVLLGPWRGPKSRTLKVLP